MEESDQDQAVSRPAKVPFQTTRWSLILAAREGDLGEALGVPPPRAD